MWHRRGKWNIVNMSDLDQMVRTLNTVKEVLLPCMGNMLAPCREHVKEEPKGGGGDIFESD